MGKQPELETLTADYTNKTRMNKNFENIVKAFRNALFRNDTGNEPNAMNTDYNVGDANVTNVNELVVNSISVENTAFTGFGEQYVHKLGSLTCSSGHMLSHDIDGDPRCLTLGDEGQVLGTDGTDNAWLEDIDTDTDTIGITVQEDGVTVAENVTNIDFLWTPSVIATTPASDQVDLALEELLDIWKYGPFTGSASAPDTGGIIASASALWGTSSHIRRLVLPETTTDSSGDCWAVFEGHNYFLIGASPAPGTWAVSTRFYGPDGTDDRSTVGTQIGGQLGHTNSTAGGATLTFFRKVNLTGVKYVDVSYSLLAVSPLSLTTTDICHRYVGIFGGSLAFAQSYETPSGVVFANSGSSQTSSASGNTACPVF